MACKASWSLVALVVAVPIAAAGQTADEALVRWGKLATVAPLCGLRDEAWAFDLRRSELQRATGSDRSDDEGLRQAPGRQQAEAALSFAETNAMEDFAGQPREQTCSPLADAPELHQADEMVHAFRLRRGVEPGT